MIAIEDRTGSLGALECITMLFFFSFLTYEIRKVMSITNIYFLLSIFCRKVYDDVQEEAHIVWCFQRYQIVDEYVRRSAIPNPFSIISDIVHFFRWMLCRPPCSRDKKSNIRKGKVKLTSSYQFIKLKITLHERWIQKFNFQ